MIPGRLAPVWLNQVFISGMLIFPWEGHYGDKKAFSFPGGGTTKGFIIHSGKRAVAGATVTNPAYTVTEISTLMLFLLAFEYGQVW